MRVLFRLPREFDLNECFHLRCLTRRARIRAICSGFGPLLHFYFLSSKLTSFLMSYVDVIALPHSLRHIFSLIHQLGLKRHEETSTML